VCSVNLSSNFGVNISEWGKNFRLLSTLLFFLLKTKRHWVYTWLAFSKHTSTVACPLLDTPCSLVFCWTPDNGCRAHSVPPHLKSYPNTANASQHILPKPARTEKHHGMSGRFLYKCLNGLFETNSSPTHVMYQMLDEHNFQMPQQTFKESVIRENVCGISKPSGLGPIYSWY